MWNADLAKSLPMVSYQSAQSAQSAQSDLLRAIATNICSYGICFVEGVPPSVDGAEQLLRHIGPLRNTHFGSGHIVQANMLSKDTAYTNAGLPLHTDTTYFTEPARILAMHCLHEGVGGRSMFADGRYISSQLATLDRNAFLILSKTGIFCHASGNDGISIQPWHSYPVLELDPDNGELFRVRYNNLDRVKIDGDLRDIDAWYNASMELAKLINDPGNQLLMQARPGTLILIDNWRILHGRHSYIGRRQMYTAYVQHDDFTAFVKRHCFSEEQVNSTLKC